MLSDILALEMLDGIHAVSMVIKKVFASCRQDGFENGLKGYLHKRKPDYRTHCKDMEKKLL